MEKPISKITTNTIYLTIIILFINLLTTTIFQIINIKFPLRWIYLIVIIISCTLFLYNNKDNWRCKIFTLIFVLFLLLALPLIYQYTYDFSIDGNSYHKPAIAFLKEGWNPIYQNSSSFAKANDYLPGGYNIWVDHYPKAT